MSEESGGVWIREGPRVPFESTAWLGVEDREDGSPYRTENLSPSGVMLRGERPLVVVGAERQSVRRLRHHLWNRPSEGFLGSLQVAEKRRGKGVGQENPAPVDVVPPTPETLQEGSGLRLGSVLGRDAPRFVVRIADLEGPLDKSLPLLKTPEAIGIRAGWHETERGGELHLVFDLTSADVVASAEVSAGAIVVSLDHID